MDSYRVEIFRQTPAQLRLRLHDTKGGLRAERDLDSAGLGELIAASERYYSSGRGNIAELGQKLYQWLDGPSAGWLGRMRAEHGALTLHITAEEGLRHLPWELLLADGIFLCTTDTHPIAPVRRVHERGILKAPQNRALRVLFM